MVKPVAILNINIVANIHLFKTGDVDAVFRWIAAPLVMGIYPADGTKIMPGDTRSPLVEGQLVFAVKNFQVLNLHTGDDSPATRTI